MKHAFVVPLMLAATAWAVEIPNKIVGNAEVDCGEDFIDVVWTTEAPFGGRVFAIGFAGDDECEAIADRNNLKNSISIRLPKDKCGVNPNRSPQGLFVNFKVMVSFHHSFITKADRGFEISCFYMNVDKTVTFPLTVSMKDLIGFTVPAEMPQCIYQVLEQETGEEATVVAVGDKLLHKWTCNTQAPSLWCMHVKDCKVKDDSGVSFTVIDQDGCAKDQFLLRNLIYGSPEGDGREGMHLMAEQEAHAFKFADKVVVNFECTIGLSIRPETGCEAERPECPELSRRSRARSRLARLRRVRSADDQEDEEEVEEQLPVRFHTIEDINQSDEIEVDVRAQKIDVLDPIGDFGLEADDPRFRAALAHVGHSGRHTAGVRNGDCISSNMLLVPLALIAALLTAMLVMIVVLWRHNVALRLKTNIKF